MTQCFITRWNTLKFIKNTLLRNVFSTLFSVFHLVMKQCVSRLIYNASVNCSCAQSPICLPCQSGSGVANFALPEDQAFTNPGPPPSFWHTHGFLSKYNYTEDFTGKTSKLAHLLRVVMAFSRSFYACVSSLLIKPELHSEIGSFWHESTFFGYWIKFLLKLFKEHPLIFIKLFRTDSITAHY